MDSRRPSVTSFVHIGLVVGSGILGLTDRVEALGGTISIASPPHGGTTLSVRLPNLATLGQHSRR